MPSLTPFSLHLCLRACFHRGIKHCRPSYKAHHKRSPADHFCGEVEPCDEGDRFKWITDIERLLRMHSEAEWDDDHRRDSGYRSASDDHPANVASAPSTSLSSSLSSTSGDIPIGIGFEPTFFDVNGRCRCEGDGCLARLKSRGSYNELSATEVCRSFLGLD